MSLRGIKKSGGVVSNSLEYIPKTLAADNIDSLVLKGIRHIKRHGSRIQVTAGSGIQAYGVNYVLLDSRQRIHGLRYPESLVYLCRELLAFFKGSRKVEEGLAQASSYWRKIADEAGTIHSNYGFYIFHQKVNGFTQYEWVISNLKRNIQSRKALCNINQPIHKDPNSKDFPCTIAAQFLVRNNRLCCEVSSRSEDIITGLPYDIGFFSFLNELVWADLNSCRMEPVDLGYTMIRCSFTQIYDRTAERANIMLRKSATTDPPAIMMPIIVDAEEVLEDIYHGTKQSEVIRWIASHAELG